MIEHVQFETVHILKFLLQTVSCWTWKKKTSNKKLSNKISYEASKQRDFSLILFPSFFYVFYIHTKEINSI